MEVDRLLTIGMSLSIEFANFDSFEMPGLNMGYNSR